MIECTKSRDHYNKVKQTHLITFLLNGWSLIHLICHFRTSMCQQIVEFYEEGGGYMGKEIGPVSLLEF